MAETQEYKPNYTTVFKVFAHVTFATIALAKAVRWPQSTAIGRNTIFGLL